MSEQNDVSTDVNNEQDQQDTVTVTEGTEPVNTEAAEAAVETVEETAPEETPEPPSVEELLLRDHKSKVLGKDRISRSQMQSYLKFLSTNPETGQQEVFGEDEEVPEGVEPRSILQHPFITDILGQFDTQTWGLVAKYGKNRLGDKQDEVDSAYVDMWNEWKATQSPVPPKSHMWLKGIVAAALLIAEREGELTQDRWETPVEQEATSATEQAIEAATAEAEAKDAALAEGESAPESEPEQEQPAPEPSESPESEQGEE
jgi:hypothetical protein